MPDIQKGGDRAVTVMGDEGVGKEKIIHLFVKALNILYGQDKDEGSYSAAAILDGYWWQLYFESLHPSHLGPDAPVINHFEYSERYIDHAIGKANGLILVYDIASIKSFELVTRLYRSAWKCRPAVPRGVRSHMSGSRFVDKEYRAVKPRFGCILVGNKANLATKNREVSKGLAESWADSQGMKCFEIGAFTLETLEQALRALIRSMVIARQRNAEDTRELQERLQGKSDSGVILMLRKLLSWD